MKPGDHPDFFRLPPPPGASRESTIRLDRDGRFWHDGAVVEHVPLARAFARWIAKHPDDGRLILTNGYDWTYFTVDDAPYFVDALRADEGGAGATLCLSDGTEERLDPRTLSVGDGGVVYARVKGGAFEARFSRHAQTSLGPWLTSADPPTITASGIEHVLGPRPR